MLGRDVLIAQLLGFLLGAVEDLVELAGEVGLRIALLWIARYLALGALAKRGDARAELLEDRNDNALLLVEQRPEQMDIVDDRIAVSPSEIDGLVQRFAGFHGETFGVDHGAA